MPISAEQWKISVGLLCTCLPVISRNIVRNNLWCVLWNALLCPLMDLLWFGNSHGAINSMQRHFPVDEDTKSMKLHSLPCWAQWLYKMKLRDFTNVVLTVFLLVVVMGLLLRSGNVESNPGPSNPLTPMDLSRVRHYLIDASVEWEDIGLDLNLDPQELDRIKANNGEVEKCLTAMLDHWLKQSLPKPTWSALIAVLRLPTVGEKDIADDIAERELEIRDSSVYTLDEQDNSSAGTGALSLKNLAFVRRKLFKARTEWEAIGHALSLPCDTLKTIEAENRHCIGPIKRCFTDMLKKWLKQTDQPRTWSALLDALRQPSVGCKDLVGEIECSFDRQGCVAMTTDGSMNSGGESHLTSKDVTSVSEAGTQTRVSPEVSGTQRSGSERLHGRSLKAKVEELKKNFNSIADKAGIVVLESKKSYISNVDKFRTLIEPHGDTNQNRYKTFFGKKYLKGKTTEELWKNLKKIWDYLNYFLLERVVSVIEEEELKQKMSDHADKVAKFRESTLLRDFQEHLHTLNKVHEGLLRNFTSKHELDWDKCTLQHLEDKKELIACIFSLPKRIGVILRGYKKGCVSVTWSLPCEAVHDLKEDIESMDINLFRKHQILEIDFDGEKYIFFVTENCASFLQERYLSISKHENYISEFKLAQVFKKKAERHQMDDSMKPSIQGGNDDIEYEKTALTEEELNDKLSLSTSHQQRQLVLIEGAAGLGKTTFSKQYCRKWALGESMQQYSLVVLLPLRDIRVKSAVVISDLFYWYDQSQRQRLVQEMEETQGEGIAFWFEGWDELDEHLRTKSSIFLDLIDGKILPKASIFITSRHWASDTIIKKLRRVKYLHIEILSLPEEQLLLLLKTRKEKWDATHFTDYIRQQSNVAIYAAMRNPIAADIAADVFQWSKESSMPPPSTLTQLYTMYVYKKINQDMDLPIEASTIIENWDVHCFGSLPEDVRKKFERICKIAFSGIENRQFVFELKETSFGLLDEADQVFDSEHTSFLHTTVQEYLAAIHISKMPSSEQTKLFKKYQKSNLAMYGHFQVPLRFAAGVTHLESLVKEEKKAKIISSLLRSDPLTVLRWLFETGDAGIIGTVLPKQLAVCSKRSWLPLDFFITGHCISFSECEWSLEFSQLSGDEELKMFIQGLIVNNETSQHCGGNISKLKFRAVKFRADDVDLLAKIPPRMWHGLITLEISSNCEWPSNKNIADVLADAVPEMRSLKELKIISPIVHGGAVKLLEALQTSNTTLSCLDLSKSNIGDRDCEFVGKLLATSTSLTALHVCELSQRSVFSILKGLRTNHKFQELDLTASVFSRESMELLTSVLEDPNFELRHLHLFECLIDIPQVTQLARALVHNQSLKYLNLAYNVEIGKDHPDYKPQDNPRGVKAIAAMLAQNTCLEALIVHKCSITSRGVALLADVLIETNSTLNELNIAQNKIDSDVTVKLAELIRKNKSLKWMRFENSPLTAKDCYILNDAMKSNNTLVRIIFPSCNFQSFEKLLKERGETKDPRITT